MDTLHFLADTLYTLHELPLTCFQSDEFSFSTYRIDEHTPLMKQDRELLRWLHAQYHDRPTFVTEDSNILYGLCKDAQNHFVIAGPFSLRTLTHSEQRDYRKRHGIPDASGFMIYIHPVTAAASVLSLLNLEMNKTRIRPDEIIQTLPENSISSKIREEELFFYHLQNSENQRKHITYAHEKSMISAFASGNYDALKDVFDPSLLDHVGQLAVSPYKQLEYTVVSGVHFYSRAAIEGGVAPQTAYDLSDLALQKASVCHSETELLQVMTDAKKAFFDAVKHARDAKQKYRYIEQTKQYVARHLYSRFTIQDIAGSIGINASYLSSHFSKHEGKTLNRYIQEERIQAVKNMLRFSDLPISVIANYLCFDSQSHLGSVFKKITGTTPATYRTQNQTENFHSD